MDVLHLNAQTSVGQGDFETAEKTFKNALSSLNKLDKAFGDTDGEFPR